MALSYLFRRPGRALDLHDVGAEVSEEHRAVRAREQEHNLVDRYLQL